ncbi:hypothetical protein BC826DRAFT_1161670 [Russula brevipes]|nr:hypothetical protein BC826DRAFT_1161670 [Russula brevipes]
MTPFGLVPYIEPSDEMRAMNNRQVSFVKASPISWCTNAITLPHDSSATVRHSIPPVIGGGLVWRRHRKLLRLRDRTSIVLRKGGVQNISSLPEVPILSRYGGDDWSTVTPPVVKVVPLGPRSIKGVQAVVSNAEAHGEHTYNLIKISPSEAQAVLRDADPKLHTGHAQAAPVPTPFHLPKAKANITSRERYWEYIAKDRAA